MSDYKLPEGAEASLAQNNTPNYGSLPINYAPQGDAPIVDSNPVVPGDGGSYIPPTGHRIQ